MGVRNEVVKQRDGVSERLVVRKERNEVAR